MISAILKKYIKVSQNTGKPKNIDSAKIAGNNRPKPRNYYMPILVSNIFGLKNVSISDTTPKPGTPDGEAPETKLNIELIGTIIDTNLSKAVLKNLDNEKTNGYFVGEEVDIYKSEKIKISRVDNCKVILERRSGFETIKCKTMAAVSGRPKPKDKYRPKPTKPSEDNDEDQVMDEGIKKVGENQFDIDQDLLDELLEDINGIMSEVRVIPNDEGLKLFGMRPNTFFYKIGLRNGDTLNMINDVELTDVSNALGIFEQLKGQPNFTINLTRRKKKLTFEYSVK